MMKTRDNLIEDLVDRCMERYVKILKQSSFETDPPLVSSARKSIKGHKPKSTKRREE